LVASDLSSSGVVSIEEASNNIPAAALANSSAQTANIFNKCNANLNEKMAFTEIWIQI
jgi:predicted component of type VI protein secretion system